MYSTLRFSARPAAPGRERPVSAAAAGVAQTPPRAALRLIRLISSSSRVYYYE
jgi:hypothetical protein